MDKIKIGIVEDDEVISNNIRIILNKLGYETSPPATNFYEAIEMLNLFNPDLVMLDIQLEGEKDGIELAHIMNEKYHTPFIFLTSNSDKTTIERAKKVMPPAYLIKPFTQDDLFSAIEISLYNFSQQNLDHPENQSDNKADITFIKDGYFFHKVKTNDILYMESDHVYVNVYTTTRKITVRTSLSNYIESFDPKMFLRIHRSYAINIYHIDMIDTSNVTVNGVKLPITKSHRVELTNRLNLK